MKKFFIIPIFLFSIFFLGISSISAMELELTINEIKVQESQSSQYNLSISSFTRYGIPFLGFNGSNTNVQFAKKFSFYNSSFSALDNSKTYNIDFILFDQNQGFPLVYSNTRACSVSNAVSDIRRLVAPSLTETLENTEDLYFVSCSMYTNTNTSIFVYHNSGLQTGSQYAQPIAISPYVRIYENIDSQIDSINDKLDKQQQDNDEWKNTDLSSSDKQAPDTTDYNNYQSAENNLFGKMEYADTNSLNISTDSNTLSWIWSTIISFYNSNALLMNFVVSILSIGIIKMALGR